MQTPLWPSNDRERSNSLESLALVYTPAEARFDRITRLVKRHFQVDTCLVSLVYKDMQWFKSVQGLNACSTSRDLSFCGHVILQEDLFEVSDTLDDLRFSDNPLVLGGPKIRFYVGYPLRDKAGLKLGTLCMFGGTPRVLSREDRRDFIEFAALAELEVERSELSPVVDDLIRSQTESRRALLLDGVTGCWNHQGILEVLRRESHVAQLQGESLGLFTLHLEDFSSMQQLYGDLRLVDVQKEVASLTRGVAPPVCSLGTVGPDTWLLVYPRCNSELLSELQARLVRAHDGGGVMSHGVELWPRVQVRSCLYNTGQLAAISASDLMDSFLRAS